MGKLLWPRPFLKSITTKPSASSRLAFKFSAITAVFNQDDPNQESPEVEQCIESASRFYFSQMLDSPTLKKLQQLEKEYPKMQVKVQAQYKLYQHPKHYRSEPFLVSITIQDGPPGLEKHQFDLNSATDEACDCERTKDKKPLYVNRCVQGNYSQLQDFIDQI
jgi:hypothetical protein